MKQRDARLAALAAGGELSPAEQHRFDRVRREDGAVEQAAQELRQLREALLAVREEAEATGSTDRTIQALRERIASEGAGHGKPWRWVLVPAGLALATLALGGMLQWRVSQLEAVAPPEAVAAAIATPELPDVGRRRAARAVAGSASRSERTEIARSVAEANPGGPEAVQQPDFLETAMARVDEILPQEDGSYRLRLRTQNPNVVVYLIQGEAKESENGGE
jgi:hypothetical protein